MFGLYSWGIANHQDLQAEERYAPYTFGKIRQTEAIPAKLGGIMLSFYCNQQQGFSKNAKYKLGQRQASVFKKDCGKK